MQAKICGITNIEDAKHALSAGADYIGIILSKKSKRFVSLLEAKRMIEALKLYQHQIVGVFLDEPIQEIASIVKELGLKYAQFIAPKSPQKLTPLQHITPFLVIQVDDKGAYHRLEYTPEKGYILYDGMHAGSGRPINWELFYPQEHRPFFIAGGLTASVLPQLFKRFEPDGVDVATHVCYPDGIRKDPQKVTEFIQKAHDAQ
jgi:phosphoribosylanthranilate isomerase